MRNVILISNLLLMTAELTAQVPSDTDLMLMGRIRQHLRPSISELPSYTCVETMERRMFTPQGDVAFHERIRVQVLAVDQQEQFAWPEETEFKLAAPWELISAGAVGASSFTAMMGNLFVGSAAVIKSYGIETVGGLAAHRFDFQMALLSSRLVLTVGSRSARIAYSGSFWVDQHSLDLLRLQWRAEDIPPDLDCREARHQVTFGRAGFRGRDWLIPSAAELVMVNRQGGESRNSVTFSDCQRFSAATSISFATDPTPLVSAPAPIRLQLPPGMRLVIRTEQSITSTQSAVGDLIYGRLDQAVVTKEAVLPKGTRLVGRLRRLEHHYSPKSLFRVGMEFFAAEAANGHISLRAHLIGPRPIPESLVAFEDGRMPRIDRGAPGLDIEDEGTESGVGIFRVQGKSLSIGRGFRTIWRTH